MRAQRQDIPGNVKVTREDWLNGAMDILVSHGVAEVKVLSIADRLGVSRSSFYWYFKDRKDLLAALLAEWERTNTKALIEHAGLPAKTITEAVCNLFRCFLDARFFNHRLDFAIREWARRDKAVRQIIDQSDEVRRAAIAAMFERFGFASGEADIRARILYYMQIGYYALDLGETLDTRMSRIPGYLEGFTGKTPSPDEVAGVRAYVGALSSDAAD